MKQSIYFSFPHITLQEVPDEISLALSMSGCPMKCKGCHSAFTWPEKFGQELKDDLFKSLILNNKHISCVLFYGGEWKEKRLLELFNIVKLYHLKIALYTGLEFDKVSQNIMNNLDYLKIGPYNSNLGPLNKKTTNQKILKKVDNKWIDITSSFWNRFSEK